jgi:glycerophosphoryl diester phosphodiesterase
MDLDHLYQGRTLVFAHRGASGHAPQNTLAAFRLAAEMGADGVELDVHLSGDGEAVVVHDATVDATTDGQGRVSAMTLSELQALDAGRWFDERFAGERVPTLQEVFDAIGHRLLINVEIKATLGHHSMALEAEVVRLIEDNQMSERVIVSSFSPTSLRRVRKLNPNIPLGLLYGKPEPAMLPFLMRCLLVPYDALHPGYGLVNAALVARAKRQRKRVNVWTVNDADEMRRLCDLGVDGIITNYPDRLRDVLAER